VKGAEAVREEILESFEEALVPPVVYYNRALDAGDEGDAYTRGTQLAALVRNYPDYVPGLAALANYALARIPPRPEATGFEGDMEAGGFQSRGMAEQARILRVEVPAVLERMEASLKRHPLSPGVTPEGAAELLVEYFKLSRKVGRDQDALFWATLERLSPARGECPPLLAWYAVSSLLTQGHYRDARRLFEQYQHGAEPKAPWEKECAAYFAAQNGDARTALGLYASLIESAAQSTYRAPLGVHINYTLVLAGSGQYRQAVAYCRRAMQTVRDPSDQARMAFFLAELQVEMQESAEALRTLEYCLLLKPDHQQARALLRKLRG
jgi:tetratricopeptide (TPR) repeat protein